MSSFYPHSRDPASSSCGYFPHSGYDPITSLSKVQNRTFPSIRSFEKSVSRTEYVSRLYKILVYIGNTSMLYFYSHLWSFRTKIVHLVTFALKLIAMQKPKDSEKFSLEGLEKISK